MEERRRAGSTGYVVVLLGVVAFVGGCFLPYFDYRQSGVGSLSLYRLYTLSLGGEGTSVSGVLILFAGVATLAWVAVAGIRGSGNWTRPALAAVAIAWSLTWIGTLLGHTQLGAPRVFGYWVLVVAVGVVMIGTIVVWISPRGDIPTTKPEVPAS